jgi:hypothetical protein
VKREDQGPSRRERRKAKQERPGPHDCEDVRRVRAACKELYAVAGRGQQTILVGKLLGILDPDYKQAPPPDPRADPLFGTMPVDAASYQGDDPASPTGP